MDSYYNYKNEESKAIQYEALSNSFMQENETEIAYRDLNSRYNLAEQKYLEADEFTKRSRERQSKKKKIEEAWHKNTSEKKKELEKGKNGSPKDASYYESFTLKELEVFIKNSDRGGNSKEYNDVATDLEVYNRVMSADYADPNEGVTLLKRIQESCNTYLTTRKKTFWRSGTGKIRRAIIESISIKVNASIEMETTRIKEESEKTKKAYKEERTDENVEKALKANYDMVYQVLQGNIKLDKKQMAALDKDIKEIMEELMDNKVDMSQSDSLSTRFFNALGWSGSKAKLVEPDEFLKDGNAMKTSPLKKKMYHSMNPVGKSENANDLAEQLAGTKEKDNRLYYGLGRFGKGIYTSTQNENETSSDKLAYNNSWEYGKMKGASMVIMTLNEYARIATQDLVMKKLEDLEVIFPQLTKFIQKNEKISKGGYIDYLTIIAALFGYNTIKGPSGIKSKKNKNDADDVDYYTTTDRKALTISKEVEVRIKESEKDDDEYKDKDYEISYLDIKTYNLETKQMGY
ncbi:MAG: hypothetical protein IJT72_02595 [Lachnospiraceae bacterium]|nr:hypothetical protein [Lachnospiraceae bacterium]